MVGFKATAYPLDCELQLVFLGKWTEKERETEREKESELWPVGVIMAGKSQEMNSPSISIKRFIKQSGTKSTYT